MSDCTLHFEQRPDDLVIGVERPRGIASANAFEDVDVLPREQAGTHGPDSAGAAERGPLGDRMTLSRR